MTDDFLIDHHYKSFPLSAAPVRASEIGQRGWNVLADDLAYPLAVLSRSALEHNLAWMQDFAQRKGVLLAPHGKTAMSAAIFQHQLAAGAWGLTFATVHQASVGVAAGARNIIIANQMLAPADLDGIETLLARHTDLRLWFLVDSLAQLAAIEGWARQRNSARRFDVLLEIGIAGQRTGCRTAAQAMELAHAVSRSPAARLGGIECYEGGAARCDSQQDIDAVSDLVRRVLVVAQQCDAAALFADAQILLTAGGSAVFDLVVPLLKAEGLSRPVRGVLRSGCYITHDHGNYARFLRLVEQREGLDGSLRAALEVWALVQSVPEPGLALLSCGRRDISYDLEMPIPLRTAAHGTRQQNAVPTDWKISALNDHHAYLRFDPSGTVPQVGGRVALGISHPCTTFDKWRWLPVVEDDGGISGAINTQF